MGTEMKITGASNFVNRMFEAGGKYQWARELLKNSLEAEATRVEFGIEWQAVAEHGVYHRTVADNGIGMDKEELRRFFSTLGEGGKKIGGVHDNFGVGAKIASLPWNPEGVVVLSYKEGRGAMIWIELNPESGNYELVDFDHDDGRKSAVIDPDQVNWQELDWAGTDWSLVAPEWAREHGTVVVLRGSEEHPDTVLGDLDNEEDSTKGLSIYLNTRFWDLSDVDVRVVELVSTKKNRWPRNAEDSDSLNRRRINGARYYLTEVSSTKGNGGKLGDSGLLLLDDDRVEAEWYLWEGERPQIHAYAQEGGYVAVRYKGELFQVSNYKTRFRRFGIIESEVQRRTTIILEPQHYHPGAVSWGVHPDQSRNRLIFTGHGDKSVDLPMTEWGRMFVEQMPEPIHQAIREARGNASAELDNEEYRRRLQDKFGDRWKTKKLVVSSDEGGGRPATPTDEDVEVFDNPPGSESGRGKRRSKSKKKGRSRPIKRKSNPGGDGAATPREAPVDVPNIRLNGRKDDFEKPWHIALFAPEDPEGPTVVINADSGILNEVIEYHQERYPEVYAEEIADVIRQVFGQVAACKVAHSQKLAEEIAEEELNDSYRSEKALTVALMGLMAEEALIAPRLGRFGRKREPDTSEKEEESSAVAV